MKPLSDPLNSLPLVGGLLMWYPSLPVLKKKLAGAAAIRIAAWGGGGEAPMLKIEGSAGSFSHMMFCIFIPE